MDEPQPRRSQRPLALAGRILVVLAAAVAAAQCAGAAAGARVALLTGGQVIQILDQTVEWYRALGTQQQNATQPSDLLILFANRQTADKVVSLAFDMARANAELLSSEASAATPDGTTAGQALSTHQAQLATQLQAVQQEISVDRAQLARPGKGRQELQAKLAELQGELAMINARKNMLDTMSEFIRGTDPKTASATALKSQIDAIAATVPAAGVAVTSTAAAATAAAPAAPGAVATAAPGAGATPPGRYGILDLVTEVLRQHGKLTTIAAVDARTKALADTFHGLSAAPLAQLKAFSSRGDALAARADQADSAELKDLRDQFDTLAWFVQQTSDVLVPLAKEQVLLQRYRRNLDSWHDSVEKQYREAWSALGVRLGILAGILAVVFVLGEVWRRAVLRYVRDSHRRYQLLLVRTIVLWTVVVAVVGLSFVTEISTFATFAGLLTAGLAVAMQSVLVSVVGYFFLIGKYGIRVGDRIQIGTVVGEVLDIGLVRLHLMELNQQGPLGSTGRVVAFPNLIVFQTTGGLFKQASGNELTWHETTVPLPVVADYAALKQQLLTATTAAVASAGIATGSAENAIQLHMRLNGSRMEALIRYPQDFKRAAQVDESVAQAVLKVLAEQAPPPAG